MSLHKAEYLLKYRGENIHLNTDVGAGWTPRTKAPEEASDSLQPAESVTRSRRRRRGRPCLGGFVPPSLPGNEPRSKKTWARVHTHRLRSYQDPRASLLQRVRWSVPKAHSCVQMALFRLHGNLPLKPSSSPTIPLSAAGAFVNLLSVVCNLACDPWIAPALKLFQPEKQQWNINQELCRTAFTIPTASSQVSCSMLQQTT